MAIPEIKFGFFSGLWAVGLAFLASFLHCLPFYWNFHLATLIYSRGGQLVFERDRLENFLLSRDRPQSVIKSQVENAIKRNIDWKMFFWVILSIKCKIRRDRSTDTWRSTGRSRSACWPPLIYSSLMETH